MRLGRWAVNEGVDDEDEDEVSGLLIEISGESLVVDAGAGVGVGVDVDVVDIPFELVGEVASAGSVTETGHVKGLAATRHGNGKGEGGYMMMQWVIWGDKRREN